MSRIGNETMICGEEFGFEEIAEDICTNQHLRFPGPGCGDISPMRPMAMQASFLEAYF